MSAIPPRPFWTHDPDTNVGADLTLVALAPQSSFRRRRRRGACSRRCASSLGERFLGRPRRSADPCGPPARSGRPEQFAEPFRSAQSAEPRRFGRPARQGEARDTVSVNLASGRVLATAVGPTVPEDGRFPVPATSPCTFVVTPAGASGAIPVSVSAFTFIDELGRLRHPRVTTMGGGAPPLEVLPGRTVSLKVYDVLPTGDGGLSWAPSGGRPIASWDFDVEID